MKRRSFLKVLGAVVVAITVAPVLALTKWAIGKTHKWSGRGELGVWIDPANWFGGEIPASGDSILFDAGGPKQLCKIPPGIEIDTLTIGPKFRGTVEVEADPRNFRTIDEPRDFRPLAVTDVSPYGVRG